ncbi:MAG: hypothetical protein SVV03_04080 [Candidatus Nanohaloarchaea archaeon]|nr:hypothetical protein [Candidatus Nanohaloarchaea archaeon]
MSQDLESIFRAYDIRGKDQLTPEVMEKIGKSYGTYLKRRGDTEKVVVAHDMRNNSEELYTAFITGLANTGIERIVELGMEPFGVALYYGWVERIETAYITASHLSREWNGVKFYHPSGVGYTEEENMAVKELFFEGDFELGPCEVESADPRDVYIDYLSSKVSPGRMEVVLDCGNGVAGLTAPQVFERSGFEVETLFGEPDGDFPNRDSEITDETITELKREVTDSDLGIAYDGDSDRCSIVTPSGRLLEADETAYIVLDEILGQKKHTQGFADKIVANVECSMMLEEVAERHGFEIVRERVGHTYLYKSLLENNAVFGVEKAGHFAVPQIFPLDDAVAASLFFASAISRMDISLEEKLEEMPEYFSDRIAFECRDEEKFKVVEALKEELSEEYKNVTTIDGVRVDLKDGWILIRASNTSPKIRLTVEAENREEFENLKKKFSKTISCQV